jgi:hypothetical protein
MDEPPSRSPVQGLISAAKVAVLNLEAIKATLGAKWDRVKPLVVAFFEAAIKSSLERDDTYFKFGELGYIILYRHCSPEEAQTKCAVLCHNVCERLFGTEGVETTIRNLIGEVDRGLAEARPVSLQAINQSLEKYGQEMFINSAARHTSRPARLPAPDLKFGHNDSCYVAWESKLSFTYRAIWDCVSRTIHSHLCQPLPPEASETEQLHNSGFCTAVSGNETDCALLDRNVLAHCATRIDQFRGARVPLQLSVPIHFSTLSRARPWVYFQEVYRQIPPSILRELVFVVFGIGGAPNVRLQQELPRLAAARQILCIADPGPNTSVQFAYAKIHAIGMELHSQPNAKSLEDSIRSIARAARSNGYESLLLGLSTANEARIARAAGVRYIEGAAFEALAADPRSALASELASLRGNRAQ